MVQSVVISSVPWQDFSRPINVVDAVACIMLQQSALSSLVCIIHANKHPYEPGFVLSAYRPTHCRTLHVFTVGVASLVHEHFCLGDAMYFQHSSLLLCRHYGFIVVICIEDHPAYAL